MGNRRSVEKALEHVGARVTRQHRPGGAARRPTGSSLPGVGAFPRAMERLRALGLDELLRERARRRRADARDLPRHAPRLRALERARRRRGPRDRARRGARARAGDAEAAADRLERGRWERPGSALARRAPRRARLLPRAQLRRRARRRAATCSAPPSTASASPRVVAHGLLLRRPVPPREVLARRPARCSRTSPASASRARSAGRAGDPLPGDRHPRRHARCASCRATSTSASDYAEDPLAAAAGVGRRRARSALHVVDLDGARGGAPVNLEHRRADRRARPGCRCSSAAACARRDAIDAALAAGVAAGDPRHGRVHRPATLLDAALAAHGDRARARLGRRARRRWSRPPAGRRPARDAAVDGGRGARSQRGVRQLRLHRRRPRRDARGHRPATRSRASPTPPRASSSTRAASARSRTSRRSPRCATRASPA